MGLCLADRAGHGSFQLRIPGGCIRGAWLLYRTIPHHGSGSESPTDGCSAGESRAAHGGSFYTLGPSGPTGLAMSPDRRRGWGIRSEIGLYEFWTFDLEARRVSGRTQFAGRPRMGLTPSSNGRHLYIHTAGPTIDVYDSETFRLLRTVDLGADMTRFMIVPSTPPAPAGARR